MSFFTLALPRTCTENTAYQTNISVLSTLKVLYNNALYKLTFYLLTYYQ